MIGGANSRLVGKLNSADRYIPCCFHDVHGGGGDGPLHF